MSEMSKERAEALASNILECHDVKPSEVKALAALALAALRERAESVPVVPEKCGCWYLVSWCYPGGRYGATEIRLNGQWSTGSMRSATKMIADYNDLGLANVVILSVFPIAAAPGKN